MKRIFLILSLLPTLFTSSFGALYYDNRVMEVFLFNNSATGQLGRYSLSVAGSGGVFQTDLVYEGSHSYSVQLDSNYHYFSPELVTALGTKSQWSISGWTYWPQGTGGNWIMMLSCQWTVFTVAFKQDATNASFYLIYDGTEINGAYASTPNEWHFASVEWNGTQVKLYIDNSLRATITDSDNIFAKTTIYPYAINRTYFENNQQASRNDKYIISDIIRNGVEAQQINFPNLHVLGPDDLIYHSNDQIGAH